LPKRLVFVNPALEKKKGEKNNSSWSKRGRGPCSCDKGKCFTSSYEGRGYGDLDGGGLKTTNIKKLRPFEGIKKVDQRYMKKTGEKKQRLRQTETFLPRRGKTCLGGKGTKKKKNVLL